MSWKTLDSETLFETDWFQIRKDEVINPNGGAHHYEWVHFKNRAVGIVPIDADGNTWLVGQDRYTLGEYSWEIPMGGVPMEEEPLDGAKRELREETGLVAAQWSELLRLETSNSITDERAVVYIAEHLTQGSSSPDDTERLKLRQLPLSEAIALAVDGSITDAISVAALLKLAAR